MKKWIMALATGVAALAALSGYAFQSGWSSISLPGDFDSGPTWDTGTHQLELISDYIWQGVFDVTRNGNFKFAANGSWEVNWGLGQEVSTIPTENMGPLLEGGGDERHISLKLPAGKYRFVFFEDTETFSVLPQESAVPAYSSVKLIGSFNDEGALPGGEMTPQGNGTWTATLDLASGARFRVQADGTIFGAHSAKGATLSSMPATLALYGTTEAVLPTPGGTFEFTMDFRSNQLSVAQTATDSFSLASVGADGAFACGAKTPGPNLQSDGDDAWSGDFMVEQDSFTLRFVGRGPDDVPARWWGFPADTTISSLPATGTLAASDSPEGAAPATFATGAGDYSFRFHPQTGIYSVHKRNAANWLQNPSFERLDGTGRPTGWTLQHASSAPAAFYDAHSGTNAAALNRLYEDWAPLSILAQDVALKNREGLPFRVSAAFRCLGDAWNGDIVRIAVQWRDPSGALLQEDSAEVPPLSPAWQTAALDTHVPGGDVTARILFQCNGAHVGETILVDDAFAGIAARRAQNFDAWGLHDAFGPLDFDWSASSAKTVPNAPEDILGGVLISRHIESVGNTKAVEIFNGTASDIDLATTPYCLQQYDNGAVSPTVSIPLDNGVIPAGGTFAVTRPFDSVNDPPAPALESFGAIGGDSSRILRTDALTFNGDDVIVLRQGTADGPVVDRVGQVSATASSSLWSRTTSDHTLVRKGTVARGNASAVTSAFDLSEWTVLDNGDFGDLGEHALSASLLPTGYSLLLDTGATLSTPALDGGVAVISFLARPQGAAAGDDLRLVVETAPDEFSDAWTQVATFFIPLSPAAFTRCECSAGNSAHTVVRFRHVADSSTNRIRLDDIEIAPASRIKRSENFAAWTDPAFAADGTHALAQWTLGGRVAANGVSGSLAANLPVDSGFVRSPTFADGVGKISFALDRPSASDFVQVTLSTSANGGATWDEVQTFDYPADAEGTTTNLSARVCIPANGCVRFDCVGGTADAILDDISVALPALDDFSPAPSVVFSSALDPAHPFAKRPFRLAATAYPRGGADILSATGYVKYTKSGRFEALPMTGDGTGGWASEALSGRNGGESIISYATVWYGGVGVVPGTPGYAVTNLSTPAATVTVSAVKSGEVWINELSYAKTDRDSGTEDHEFVEIGGKAGTDIGNWKIQLAYATVEDIAAFPSMPAWSNSPVYATCVIPAGTKIPDDNDSGCGFWLLADENDEAFPNRNSALATLDPLAGDARNSHIHNQSGVVRLVDPYGHVVHAVSYGSPADSAETIPVVQDEDDSSALSLAGTGVRYPNFDWTLAPPTPGTVNGRQTLAPVIVITSLVLADDGAIVIATDGNADNRFTDFLVLSTTNLLLDVSSWEHPAFTRTDTDETATFTLPAPLAAPTRFFAIQPLP